MPVGTVAEVPLAGLFFDARFLLVSYNDEGFIPPAAMQALLAHEGRVEVVELPYTAFRGSRNLRGRPIRVTEHLFLVER